jgi:non-ribosomal peptide synthetase component E (peptide arylation enzyme)
MALHGDIRINGTLLGYWDARRLTDLKRGTDTYTYEWSMKIWKDDQEFTASGELDHHYDDGAAALAAAVLSAGNVSLLPVRT